MPTFEDIEVEVSQKIDVDFEVFCGTCGAGLCSESNTRRSRGRGYLQVTVNVCPNCMKEKEEEIEALKLEIIKMEDEVHELSKKQTE